MPIFEYRCSACGSVSEFLVGVGKDAENVRCASCGSPRMRKVFSPMSFTVKRQAPAGCPSCPAHERAGSRSACESLGCPKAV